MPLVPFIDKENHFFDGSFIKTHPICERIYSEDPCKSFYIKIRQKKETGFFQCPHGMTVYYDNENDSFFCCLKVKGYYDQKKEEKIRNKAIIPISPCLSKLECTSLVNTAKEYNLLESFKKIETEKFQTLTHEIQGLNAQNVNICDGILQSYFREEECEISSDNAQILKERIRTVFFSSYSISQRFALESLDAGIANGFDDYRDINIYKKFDKISKFYTSKKQRVKINGNSFRTVYANSMFEFVPLLLIDNAVKYSYNHSPVDIEFNEDNENLIVTIESYGPYCGAAELPLIINKGYRGKYATQVNAGSGLGLYYVKKLCDAFEIKLDFQTGEPNNVSGMKVAKFKVILTF